MPRGGVDQRLECRTRLAFAADRAIERTALVARAANHRKAVARRGIDRDGRGFESRLAEAIETLGDGALRRVLQRRHERRVDLPVRWIVAAELGAELLPQKLFRPAATRVARLAIRLDPRTHVPRRRFLGRRYQSLIPHQREHDVAPIERAVVVCPRRERGWRANEPRDERCLSERDRTGRLPKQMLGHCLDAIHARAQIDAVQIELEDLFLAELGLDQDREARLLELAAVRLHVREKQRSRELLGQRAAAFRATAVTNVTRDGASEPDRIDARVIVEAAIFDGDDGVLEFGRDVVERDVVPLFVEPEPRLAVRAVEHRVADAARQSVDGHRIARQPNGRDDAHHDEDREEPQRKPIGETPRPEQVQDRCPLFSTTSEYPSAIAKMITINPSDSHFGMSNATYPAVCRYSTNSLTPTHAMMTNAPSTSAG